MKEENLLFIASQPRAGSTYVQNLLSNNPQTNTVSEPWVLLVLAPLLKPSLVRNAAYDHSLAIDAFTDFQEKTQSDTNAQIKQLALNFYKPLKHGFDLVIDKTPRYWEILDEISNLFPNSKILLIHRNPIDVVRSIIQTWNIKTIERLNYYRRDILLGPRVLIEFEKRHKDNLLVRSVNYDDLISNTNQIVSDLYTWLNIDYDKKMLDVSSNIKYKGKYGDPYQNNKTKIQYDLPPIFEEFIKGYEAYLNYEILQETGSDSLSGKETRAFNYFLSLGEGRVEHKYQSLLQELKLTYRKILL